MAVEVTDVERLRAFIRLDPVRNAVLAQRVFKPRGRSVVYVDDGDRVGAVAAIEIAEDDDDVHTLTFAARTRDAALEVLNDLPDGGYWMHLADEDALPELKTRIKLGWFKWSWLMVAEGEGVAPRRTCETRAIDASWAGRIAAKWARDWDASDYVRRRLEEGPSAGAFVDGDLVAWGLTHFETEEASMMGFLYVKPEHRGRGYGTSIIRALRADAASRSKVSACHIYVDNYPSLELYGRTGYVRVCRQGWGDGVALGKTL